MIKLRLHREICNGRIMVLVQVNELQESVAQHYSRDNDAAESAYTCLDALISPKVEGGDRI